MSEKIVTVRRSSGLRTNVFVSFSQLPGREWGPWHFSEAIRDLTVSAGLSRLDARSLVFDAFARGSASRVIKDA